MIILLLITYGFADIKSWDNWVTACRPSSFKKTADAPINKGQVISQYQFKSGSDKLVSLEQPNGMRVDAQALSANSKANVFVRFWRWITGVR